MPAKIFTVNKGGVTSTIIVNRDIDAGVRTMTASTHLDDTTTSIQVTVAGHSDLNGIYTGSIGGGLPWTQQGGNGKIRTSGYNSENNSEIWFVMDDNDYDPDGDSEAAFSWSGSGESPAPWTHLPSSHNVTITPVPETITVNRTAPVIDSDRKGESRPLLSKVVGGAAAAYSLRDLNERNGNNKVVRVRRASDNHERDFLAKEVSNGTLKNFVNAQTVLPLDIQAETADGRTGSVIPAVAAYSLRNLSKNYTGNVVDVRRFTDGATNSYTADEITGGTLTSFANESVKYFDSTGNTNSFGHVTTNGIQFSVVKSANFPLSFSTTGGFNNTEKYAFTGQGNTGAFTSNFYFNNTFNNTIIGASSPSKTVTIEAYVKRTSGSSSDNLYFRPYATATNAANRVIVTGLVQDEWTFVTGTLTKDSALDLKHQIQIGGDTGVTFEISNIKFFSENNDVTVSKWYDQSGNTNHAVQATPASQPKIVDAGTLITGGVTFDGSDDHFDFTEISNSGAFSLFIASAVSNNGGFVLGDDSSASSYVRYKANDLVTRIGNTDYSFGAGRQNSVLDIININRDGSNSLSVNRNGTGMGSAQTATGTFITDLIGTRVNLITPMLGAIKELIIYDTDQSDNRTAIEANIGEAYSITGIPAYDNTVDGFVETWYDQSGNGNDAVQLTSSQQPHIVKAGVLVDKGIDFDGVSSQTLQPPLLLPTIQNSSAFVINTPRVNSPTGYTFMANRSGDRMYFRPNFVTIGNPAHNFSAGITYGVRAIQTVTGTSGGLFTYFKDGSSVGTTNYTGTAGGGDSWIGSGQSGSSEFNGIISEIIVYTSDQSANRPAIEANIKNQYDIS